MARDDISPAFDRVVTSRSGETHDVCDITLPQVVLRDGTVLSEVVLNVAAARLPRALALGTVMYAPAVRQFGGIVFSQGRAPDDSQFQLENLRGIYGELMLDPDRTLNGAELVCSRAANIASRGLPKIFEFDELFRGYIHGVDVSGDVVQFTVVSDTSDPLAQVGARALTQRCADDFEGPLCGHTGAPPGAVCSHIFDDGAAGCLFWDNQERFVGVPPLAPQAAAAAGIDVLGLAPGTGFPDDAYPRFRHPFYDRDWQRPYMQMDLAA